VGLRTAVLTARLNWLDERERILRLGSNRRATLAQLKMVLGVAGIPDNLVLVEPPTDSLPDQDSCVARALDCNTEILNRKGELLQAGRDLGQTGWEFVLDDITFSAGMAKGGRSAGLELGPGAPGERAWVLDAVGTRKLSDNDGDLFPSRDTSLKFALNLEVGIPIFRGAGRHGAVIEMGARYSEARAMLIAKTREVEKRTRETYYAWQMSRDLLVIQTERVAIARESYSLAETQRELGRTTDEGLEAFRKDLFGAQDAFFGLQFEVESKEEDLRAMVRLLE
jgi:hypothetical protein